MKNRAVLIVALALFAGGLAFSAEAVMMVPTLEVTGLLEAIDESTAPMTLHLDVNGVAASGPLAETCLFWNDKEVLISREDFAKHYLKKVVTIELREDNGEVIHCRPGS
jgi:hypothetical protein